MDRKAKIKAYKETDSPMGIFQIVNKVNGKIFIGSSRNIPAILNRYKTELKLGSCRNTMLQKEWKEFGSDAFAFEELEILKSLDDQNYDPNEDLKILLDLWSEKLKPYGDNGYNKQPENKI